MRKDLAMLLAASMALGCGGDPPARTPAAHDTRADTLSAPQVAALVGLINGTEIAAAQAVQQKLVSPDARAYAAMLIADHTRLRRAMPELPGPSVPPPQAALLGAVFHSQAAMLATLPAGHSFDATFAALQIADHSMAIDSLRRWHGAVDHEALRDAIAGALPTMEAHRTRAEALYRQLGGAPPAGRRPAASGPSLPTVPADSASPEHQPHRGHDAAGHD